MSKSKILSIELSRWVAATLVLCFHVSMLLEHQPFGGFFRVGYYGVDFFFVLSGFLMFHLYAPSFGHGGVKDFLLRRFLRIFLPYWVVLMLFAGLLCFSQHARPFPVTALELLRAAALFPRGWMPPLGPADLPLIAPSWTLSCELLFYAFIALCLKVPKRVGIALSLLWPLLCLVIEVSGIVLPMPFYFFFNHLIPVFFLGALVALLAPRLSTRWATFFWSLGLGAVIFLGFKPQPSVFLGGHIRDYAFGLISALITLGVVLRERKKPLRYEKLWRWMGASSYAIYLTHYPLLVLYWWTIVAPRLHRFSTDINFLGVCGVGLLLGSAFYYFIERHLLRLGRRLTKSSNCK